MFVFTSYKGPHPRFGLTFLTLSSGVSHITLHKTGVAFTFSKLINLLPMLIDIQVDHRALTK